MITCSKFTLGLMAVCTSLLFISCKKSDLKNEDIEQPNKEVIILPERSVKVYWGKSKKWHLLTDESNWVQWNYVRQNITGFYTSFPDMWVMYFQNAETAPMTLSKLYNTFRNKGVFFETSMETKVNNGPNGFNNAESDKRNMDLLLDAGFTIDYVSLNYMTREPESVCTPRIELLRNYKGKRKCLSLHAPWKYGGDIASNVTEDNALAREIASWCDGMQTDGPMGYWVSNKGGMRESSYSIVKYAANEKKESAIMIAATAAEVPPAEYEPIKDFITIAKKCVLDHEDNDASPDIWTIWPYGADELPTFPECEMNELGETIASNSDTGVAYYLLKHLKEFPVVKLDNSSNNCVISNGRGGWNINLKPEQEIDIPIVFSNENIPSIELSPVVRAVVDLDKRGWCILFSIDGVDVTNNMIYDGGLNFVREYRISKGNPTVVNMHVKAPRVSAAESYNISFEVMSHISNTCNKKEFLPLFFNLVDRK